jgi:GTPase SAR1 family protein
VVRAEGRNVTLVLWDIHGEDVFQKVQISYLRGMSGCLLVADGTRRQTLEDALALAARVTEMMGKIPAVLVLNKCDLTGEWEIDPDRESRLAADGWRVFCSSAKTGESVEQVFSQLTLAMLEE